MGRLQDEIKQRKPFDSLESEVFLNLVRTVDALEHGVTELLKRSALTSSQYNALRILRGAGSNGLMCAEVSERMLARDPDVTRLLDRLERRGLITRAREKSDRRVVTTRVTDDGLTLLATLDEPIERVQRQQLEHMTRNDLDTLRHLLEVARAPAASTPTLASADESSRDTPPHAAADAASGVPPGEAAGAIAQQGASVRRAPAARYSGLSEK